MYEQREDTITFVRVHTIPGIFDYINFEVKNLNFYSLFRRKKFQFCFLGGNTYEILQLPQ